jgi:hypothetical protein
MPSVDPGDKRNCRNLKCEKNTSELDKNAKEYSYLSNYTIQMVEFQGDIHSFLHNVINEMGYGLMGGNLSVRMPESQSKLFTIFDQDRSVFNQFLLGI